MGFSGRLGARGGLGEDEGESLRRWMTRTMMESTWYKVNTSKMDRVLANIPAFPDCSSMVTLVVLLRSTSK